MEESGGEETSTATRTATGTAVSTATAVPGAKSINVLDRWDYAFRITNNDCGVGATVGTSYPVSFRFLPASGSGNVIRDGELVEVVVVQDKDYPNRHVPGAFRFVEFEFSYR